MLEPESQAAIKAWQRFTAIVCDYRRRAEGFRQSLWVAAGPLAARTGSRYKIGEAPRKEGALRDTLTKRKESVHAKTLAYYDAWIVASSACNHPPLKNLADHPIWTKNPKFAMLPKEAEYGHARSWPAKPSAVSRLVDVNFVLPDMVA